jgi:hypothetical protein
MAEILPRTSDGGYILEELPNCSVLFLNFMDST